MARPKREKLTDKDRLLIAEYFANGMNKKAALIAAGYSEGTASDHPEYFFEHPVIRAEIERRMKKLQNEAEIDEKWLLKRLKAIADAQIGDLIEIDGAGQPYIDWGKLTDDQRAAIQSLEVDEYIEGRGGDAVRVKKFKVKPVDRLAALIAIGRHIGFFNDSVTVKGELTLAERLQRGRERMNRENAAKKEGEEEPDA